MVMAVNGNGKERIENFGRNWTSRKKLEKWKCDENGLPEKNWKNEIATKKKLVGS